MADDKALFLRRYQTRIEEAETGRSVDKWYTIYVKKGEAVFLTKIENIEKYNKFCSNYYEPLRDAFNIDDDGMADHYELYINLSLIHI